jgi:hypothetical protein
MSSTVVASSSAISEKISAIANNQRLLVTKLGLAIAIVASLEGGLVISEDQASVINSSMAVAMYTYRHSDSTRIALEGHELLARTLGIRVSLTELRGNRSSIGAPTEMTFGDPTAPVVKVIQYDGKAKAPAEYFSYVGPAFMNNLMTQNNLNVLLSILSGPNLQEEFSSAFRPAPNTPSASANNKALEDEEEDEEEVNEGNTNNKRGEQDTNNNNNGRVSNNNADNMNIDSNSSSNASNATSLQQLLAEFAILKEQLKQRTPSTPPRMGSMSDAMSPMQNSQSSFSMMGYNAAPPIYLEKFTSAEVKAWRQKMTMHLWPNPFFRYVHHSLFDYVKGQWNVFSENSMRVIPRFEDSGSMPSDQWFDTLEEIVSEVKLDDEGVIAPILQVSSNNGLPVMVDLFMQSLWKWLHRQERLHSKPSIRQQIVATLDKCPYAKRVLEIHNMKLAEIDPQYAPRKLVSKVNEVITSLALAGQSVNDFVKFKNSKPNSAHGGSGGGKGSGSNNQSPKGAGGGSRNSSSSSSNNSNGKNNVNKDDKGKDKADAANTPATITCHECGEQGHRRGDRVCKKFDPKFDHKKRQREESPSKKNKK